MLALAEAQLQISQRIRRVERIETVELIHATGRYLAVNVVARVDNPAFDNSAMDGYALRSADLHAGALPLQGVSACGDVPGTLAPGTAMRIFTGAPLPAGADRVVIQELAAVENNTVRFAPGAEQETNIRRRGEDFRAGDALYSVGHRLAAMDVALIAAAGVPQLDVFSRPRVLVFATGDELVAPGQPLRPGQIYESNRVATLLQLKALGADVTDGGVVKDDAHALRAVLRAASDYDFVITSGGASVGDRDLVKQIFAEIGSIDFWRVKIKPGKPLAFGRLGERTHFFALPGNPVSSLVTFKLFVEPALAAWNHARHAQLMVRAVATNDFRRAPGRMEFLRAWLTAQGAEPRVDILPGQGSHMLGTLRYTNALVRVDEDVELIAAGSQVDVIPLSLEIF